MKIENFNVITKDNVILRGCKYLPENPKAVIYFSHGITVPKEGPNDTLKKTAIALAEEGFKVVTYDFRGHGSSDGLDTEVTLETSLEDLDTIILSDNETLPIGLFGFSLGAAVSIIYIATHDIDVKALAFYSPALSPNETCFENPNSIIGQAYMTMNKHGLDYAQVPNGFKIGKYFFESCKRLDATDFLPKVTAKMLIVQAIRDQMLDYKKVKSIGEKYADQYVSLDDIHGLIEKTDDAISEVKNWFNMYLK